MTDFRALCIELTDCLEKADWPLRYRYVFRQWVDIARAALADEPAAPDGREPASVTGQPSDEELLELWQGWNLGWDPQKGMVLMPHPAEYARAVLARWGNLKARVTSSTPADGEVAELVARLSAIRNDYGLRHSADCQRAADLLQRLSPPQPVPVSVSDALIKAECALSDIAEGEPMTDEGDPLQWAERRCADTLAIIRPTMRQHKIRTSEWPPLPPPTDKEPTRLRNCPTHGQQPPWAWGCPECVRQLREELAALQQRHPEPVPVSERLPGAEDCDTEGRCWVWWKNGVRWVLDEWTHHELREGQLSDCVSHWLPAHALPLPEVNNG